MEHNIREWKRMLAAEEVTELCSNLHHISVTADEDEYLMEFCSCLLWGCDWFHSILNDELMRLETLPEFQKLEKENIDRTRGDEEKGYKMTVNTLSRNDERIQRVVRLIREWAAALFESLEL